MSKWLAHDFECSSDVKGVAHWGRLSAFFRVPLGTYLSPLTSRLLPSDFLSSHQEHQWRCWTVESWILGTLMSSSRKGAYFKVFSSSLCFPLSIHRQLISISITSFSLSTNLASTLLALTCKCSAKTDTSQYAVTLPLPLLFKGSLQFSTGYIRTVHCVSTTPRSSETQHLT